MKEVTLSNSTKADNLQAVAIEIANILGANSDNDFQADGENIIEYEEEEEEEDSVYWSIDHVSWNEDGTASHAQISC